MKNAETETQALLRVLCRRTTIAVWLSSACLAILVTMLFFPRVAGHIAEMSSQVQLWLEPHLSGVLGMIIALVVVFFVASVVMSRIAPPAPADREAPENKQPKA